MRKFIQGVVIPRGKCFWSSLYREMNWNKIWLTGDKYCINDKVKEIIHMIYPVKHVSERFKMEILL